MVTQLYKKEKSFLTEKKKIWQYDNIYLSYVIKKSNVFKKISKEIRKNKKERDEEKEFIIKKEKKFY